MEVWCVVVFESGNFTTSIWGVYSTEEKALERKEELLGNKDLSSDNHYLEIKIEKHLVS